jgi:hypothetical protein
MQYINPIEILGLSNATDTTSIDTETIKKAKRKLFADIDLSDNGLFDYYGLHITKGDCEKVIDYLSNNDYKEFYLYLANNKKLNEFLVKGQTDVFSNFKQDSIFKLPEFVQFISPYFAPKFDKALLIAFENENVEQTKAILNTSFLIAQADINTAYKSVSNSIQNKIAEIDEITRDIKNEESLYDEDDIEDVVEIVKDHFPAKTLNCLPQYFQSQILKIANSINYLSNSIWDAFDTTQVPNDLTGYLLTLNIGGLDRPTFEKNFGIISRKNNERIEQQKNAPILKKYASYLIQTKNKTQEIKNKTLTPLVLQSWVNSSLSIADVNNLPSVFDEIKNQVAFSLRIMSVEVWNSYSNIDVSIDLITKANNITGLKSETKANLVEAKNQLTELKRKIDLNNLTRQRAATTPVSRPSTTTKDDNTGCLWVFGIVAVIGIIYAISNSNKSSSDNYTAPSSNTYTPPTTTDYSTNTPSSNSSSSTNTYIPLEESKYKGNQLSNGASPLNGCFGKGYSGGNATLTIKNGGSSDAIICLYSVSDDRTIRNEYVRRSSNYTISNIPQGEYRIRVFYGNDWNPTLENSCGKKGNFESDISFSEFDGTKYFEDSDRGFTTATITLYSVVGGNASSSSIDQSQFFSK